MCVFDSHADFCIFVPMSSNECIRRFSDYIFWDVDRSTLDMERQASFIVPRVLEYGQMSDWKLMLSYYGLARIVEVAKTLRSLEPKSLSFLSTLSGVPIDSFRCYTSKPLSPELLHF